MKRLTKLFLVAGLAMLIHGQAEAACGTLEVSKGDVKIQSGGKTSAAPVGAKICSGDTIIAAKDSRAKIKMEDGNELNISPDSQIVLEKYEYNVADNKKKVLLNILKGKVRAATREENMYNDKAKDGQANTFQVRTKSAVAGVRGTDFLTGFDAKTGKSDVVTFRGKVEFGQPGAGGTILNPVQVAAGQKTELSIGAPPAVPVNVPAAELKKVNSETNAATAAPAPSANDSTAGAKKDAKSPEKKDAEVSANDGAKTETKSDTKTTDAKSDAKSDSKSDSSKTSGSASSTANSGSSSANSDSTSKSSTATAPAATAGNETSTRAPAAVSTGGNSGSMLNSSDLGGGAGTTGGVSVPKVSSGVTVPTVAVPTVAAPVVPTCTFCNTVVAPGGLPSNVKITVQIK